MNQRHHPALQTATGWFLVLAFVFTCGVPFAGMSDASGLTLYERGKGVVAYF